MGVSRSSSHARWRIYRSSGPTTRRLERSLGSRATLPRIASLPATSAWLDRDDRPAWALLRGGDQGPRRRCLDATCALRSEATSCDSLNHEPGPSARSRPRPGSRATSTPLGDPWRGAKRTRSPTQTPWTQSRSCSTPRMILPTSPRPWPTGDPCSMWLDTSRRPRSRRTTWTPSRASCGRPRLGVPWRLRPRFSLTGSTVIGSRGCSFHHAAMRLLRRGHSRSAPHSPRRRTAGCDGPAEHVGQAPGGGGRVAPCEQRI